MTAYEQHLLALAVENGGGFTVEKIQARVHALHEFNPMLGHRGCRLGITFPEIYEMQTRAIFEAACEVAVASGEAVVPEVMVPREFAVP